MMRLIRKSVVTLTPGDLVAGTVNVVGNERLHVIGPQPFEKWTVARRNGKQVGWNLYYSPRIHGRRRYQQSLVPFGSMVLVQEDA